MRFDCGPTARERAIAEYARLVDWHDWFAWHPVRLGHECVWLERLERKGCHLGGRDGGFWEWEYRFTAE